MRTATASVEYNWYGQKVVVDLKACHGALVRTLLNLDLADGMPPTQAFARKIKLHPETVLRFMRGEQVGATSVNMILAGIGLRAEDVMCIAERA